MLLPRTRNTSALVAAVLASALVVGVRPTIAHADRVADLCGTVENERDDKARIAAVVALGRLNDKRAVPCLIHALSDRNTVVRGVAASALGYIGDERAIPALEKAMNDSSDAVRARARDALASIREKQARASGGGRALDPDAPVVITPKERPRMDNLPDVPTPRVLVVVNSASNKTNTGGAEMGAKLKDFLTKDLADEDDVALDPAAVEGKKLTRFTVDGSIVGMSKTDVGKNIELRVDVRLSISNEKGRMLSIVTGSATVTVSKSSYRPGEERGLWLTALENAVRGAHQNLIGYMTQQLAAR